MRFNLNIWLLLSGLIVIYTPLLKDLQTILLVGSRIIMHIYCRAHEMQKRPRRRRSPSDSGGQGRQEERIWLLISSHSPAVSPVPRHFSLGPATPVSTSLLYTDLFAFFAPLLSSLDLTFECIHIFSARRAECANRKS